MIISSTAARARRTAEVVATSGGFDAAVQLERSLYLADPETIVDVVRQANADTQRVLVVGHNPGMEELVGRLTGRSEPGPMPTAGLAHIQLEIDDWSELRVPSEGRLVNFWRPAELDDD